MSRLALRDSGAVLIAPRAEQRRLDLGGRIRAALARVVATMIASRQSQADRDIQRLLAQSGGRMTDEVERRATSAFTGSFGNRRY